jgi:arylsulfatase A-like enzyme
LADDLGWGDIGAYSRESKIPTPNIDRLISEGRKFTDAHSPSSVCTPTRYGILTGRYAWRTKLKSSVIWPWETPLISENRTTLPELLKEKGYRTAMFGKWHLGWTWPTTDNKPPTWSRAKTNIDFGGSISGGPLSHGFDTYFGDGVPNFPPYAWMVNDRMTTTRFVPKPNRIFGHAGPMSPGWRLDEVMPRITLEASQYVRRQAESEQPFFLYFPLTAPHTPISPAAPFIGLSEAGDYGDFVAQVDHTVGEIAAALKAAGKDKNTLLIFTSDNGSVSRVSSRGATRSVLRQFGHNSSGPWRGQKSDIHEGGHRVPFFVRWPGRVPAGTTSSGLMGHQDIYDSIAELVGASYDGPDSISQLSHWIQPNGQSPRASQVHHSGGGMFAFRKGDWKVILGRGSGGFTQPGTIKPKPGEPTGQLYNLAEDPAEATNLWSKRSSIRDALLAELKAIRGSD